MLLRIARILLLAASCVFAQSPAVPDTPAGRSLKMWLEVFNGGDHARIQAYVGKYDPTDSADQMVAFREQTGGFDLVSIGKSEPLHIEFSVREKASPTVAMGKLDLKDAESAVIASLMLRAVPPGASEADMHLKIDAATRARVIEG